MLSEYKRQTQCANGIGNGAQKGQKIQIKMNDKMKRTKGTRKNFGPMPNGMYMWHSH